VGVHRVQGDAHPGSFEHRTVGESGVEVSRVEGRQPVPQREVRRGRLLRLQRDHAIGTVAHVQRLATQQQLPAEDGAVQPAVLRLMRRWSSGP
jgi:hypothetical protein